MDWGRFGILVALYVVLGVALAKIGSLLGDDIGVWISGAIGAGVVSSLRALFGWPAYSRGFLDESAADESPPRRRWWRSVFLLVIAALELWFSITQIAADPATWWAYLFLVVGIIFLVMAIHPVSRAGLAWPAPPLDAGEAIVLSQRSNWVHRVGRGGTLTLTDRRLIFEPNTVEHALKLRTRSWDRADISATDVAPVGWNIFGGPLRRRLRVRFSDGRVELFVTRDSEDFSDRLNSALNRPIAP